MVQGLESGLLTTLTVIQRSEAENWDCLDWATTEAELKHVLERDVRVLSGGELQRFAIAVVAVQQSDVYMFDEPSSYLDVKQRLTAAHMIRQLLEGDHGSRRFVLVVEHDLAVLDYLSDYVCVLYGQAGGYGVVTMPFSVRVGINAFLAGFIPTENLRFRDDAMTFKVGNSARNANKSSNRNLQLNNRHRFLNVRRLIWARKTRSNSTVIHP